MFKKFLSLFLICSLCFSLTACGEKPHTPTAVELTENLSARALDLAVPSNVNPMTDFALRLFKAVRQQGENTLVSPLSVMCALAMTTNGADNETLSQMEQTLGLPVDELNTMLAAYPASLQNEDDALQTANSVWLSDSLSFEPEPSFLQHIVDYYDADVFKTPFDSTALDDINHWVSEKTNSNIEEILDNIPADAVMYLINALIFNAEWTDPYLESQLHNGVFTTEDGKKQDVTMMTSTESDFLKTDNATGFLKYYTDRYRYAFAALLPNEGVTVDELIDSLDAQTLTAVFENRDQSAAVYASLPQFEQEFSADLALTLEKMGMPDAFDPAEADFSRMGKTATDRLFISRVLHKTRIAVTPVGTEAGAATVVEMRCGSAFIPEPVTVTLDRPFVYMLIDCDTMTPFFIGTMMSAA